MDIENKELLKVNSNKEETSKSLKLFENSISNTVTDTINKNAQSTNNVKDVIDLAATSKALKNDKTVEKIVDEKTLELISDAEKKKIESETKKIQQEVEKVKQEKEKEIAELEKTKNRLEGEVANLKALDNKADAFFNANKSILKCIGVREKLSLKAMQWLMAPASVVFTIFQILLLPFSLVGFALESLMIIIGSVCNKIANNGWKIALSIIVSIVIVGLIFLIYFGITKVSALI